MAAPAAKLMPNVLLCSPLDHVGEAERGFLIIGHPRISIHFAKACALERLWVVSKDQGVKSTD